MKQLSVIIFIYFFLSSCVSIKLPDSNDQKNKVLKLNFRGSIPSSFKLIYQKEKHKVFQSSQTGNLIIARSLCPYWEETFIRELQSSLKNSKTYQDTSIIMINDRKADRMWIEGEKEGISYKIEILQFEKYGCQNSLIYLAQSYFFNEELKLFHQVIELFEVNP